MAIARVLHQAPKLAILDEPFSSMSEAMGKEMLQALITSGVTVLITAQLGCPAVGCIRRQVTLSGKGDGTHVLETCK